MKHALHVLPSLLLVALTGCSASEAEGTTTNSGATATPAPTASPSDATTPTLAAHPVIGTWTFDPAATIAGIEHELEASMAEVSQEQRDAVRALVTEMIGTTTATLTFAADQTLNGTLSTPDLQTGEPKVSTRVGTWEVNGARITSRSRFDGQGREVVESVAVEGDRLNVETMSGGRPMVMVFVRTN